MDKQVLQVMYNPAAYVDPYYLTKLAPLANTPLASLLNEVLIQKWALPTQVDFDYTGESNTAYLLKHWFFLRRTAYLLGCWYCRATLIKHADSLDLLARRFIKRRFPVRTLAAPIIPSTHSQLRHLGAHDVLHLAQQLPPVLASRAALLFAPHPPDSVSVMPFNSVLFRIAVQYAQIY